MEVNIPEAYTVNAFKNSLDTLCQLKNQDTCALSRLLKFWQGLFSVEFFCRMYDLMRLQVLFLKYLLSYHEVIIR